MEALKLLLGGSPCTHWSIAKTKNRETEPSGLGWELFLNYKIARDKYRPDYFLYENNKTMSPAIQAQITKELGVKPVVIDSALVSAQRRWRLYWVGKRSQDGTYSQVSVEQPEDRGIFLRDIRESGVPLQEKAYTLKSNYGKGVTAQQFVDSGHFPANGVAEPAPIEYTPLRSCNVVITDQNIRCAYKAGSGTAQGYSVYFDDGKSPSVIAGHANKMKVMERATGKERPVYEVRAGQITIKGQQYPIKLDDGYYIIRKLTVPECMRLQTVPEWYRFPISNTRAYKMLGNGWTVDVIAHILGHIPGIATLPVKVLSMYDGMSCGHIALDKLEANVVRYYATEIDKYAIKTTQTNYPNTVQLGDAFQVRDDGWKI